MTKEGNKKMVGCLNFDEYEIELKHINEEKGQQAFKLNTLNSDAEFFFK